MVEVYNSFTAAAAAISTIIVVTMATIFFCCWRKKGDGDITEAKKGSKKEKSIKEGSEKERSASPASAVGRQENGVANDTASSPAFVDSTEDLGDFSAVQRETEILRSYRKPPPPKNRARQSRAPRAFKSSTENLDIFTELSEEESRYNSENNENISGIDDPDSALLRPRAEDKESTTRDARSSMLADIEQTLAALHEQQSQPLTGKDSPKNIRTSPAQSPVKEIRKGGGDEQSDKPETASELLASSPGTDTSKPTEPPVVSVEPSKDSSSSISSPSSKPKQAPKVSPKPSPKVRAKFRDAEKHAAGGSLSVPSNNGDSETSVTLGDSSTNASQEDQASDLVLASSPPAEAEKSEAEVTEKITALASQIVSQVTAEALKTQDSADSPQDQDQDQVSTKQPDSNSSTADTTTERDSVKSTNSSTSPPPVKAPATAAQNESPEATKSGDSLTNGNLSKEPEGQDQAKAASVSPQATPERQFSNSSSPARNTPASSATSPAKGHNGKVADVGSPAGQGSAKSQDAGAGAEDQSGKGKTSKIPVRAGST